MFLPKAWKVDYCIASQKAEKEWVTYLLWEAITPGWTAIFLALTGLWYFYKRKNATEEEKGAYAEAAWAFLLWGLFNLFVYVVLVTVQRSYKLA